MNYSKSKLSRHNLNTHTALVLAVSPTLEIPVRVKSKPATLHAVNLGYKVDLWLVSSSGVSTCRKSDLSEELWVKIQTHFAELSDGTEAVSLPGITRPYLV